MMWIRLIVMAMFSVTSISLLTYQGIEIFHAFGNYFDQK
ncbi:hypothetical protein SAMN05877842_10337 [Ureibacillus acetophenoni]|uniref:Uncharacterized protein n=1 Tax=Ureibacillus acetophenoni TaxID=614649 RepID=A0A285U989_9BACL|nr:hypothetical protein SAMN05877842_10337 [Ureibacillus acetophenoni]